MNTEDMGPDVLPKVLGIGCVHELRFGMMYQLTHLQYKNR